MQIKSCRMKKDILHTAVLFLFCFRKSPAFFGRAVEKTAKQPVKQYTKEPAERIQPQIIDIGRPGEKKLRRLNRQRKKKTKSNNLRKRNPPQTRKQKTNRNKNGDIPQEINPKANGIPVF